MPIWYYAVNPLLAAIITIVFVETLSLAGLFLARRFLLPHLNYNEGINDAVSGTVQAIGVFYGITVGLIAVGVWNTDSSAGDLVSKEASAIGGMYRDVAGLPAPLNRELCDKLREYTEFVVYQEWPAQRQGQIIDGGTKIINDFQFKLFAFEPATVGQSNLHNEALRAFNLFADSRRRRLDAVGSGLSGIMWGVIWVGAVFSIGVAYLFNIQDAKMHALLVGLMGGFLAIVLFMIAINDRPFYGRTSVTTDSYQLLLDRIHTAPVPK